jgi:hypothetical protein
MLVACIALLVSLGGVSYAATVLPTNSVGRSQLQRNAVASGKVRPNAITSAKVKDGTLLARDFKAGALPAGPQGPAGADGRPGPKGETGPKGDAGPQGEPATNLFAAIGADGSLVHGKGVTASTSTGPGHYWVTFDRSLAGCVATADHSVEGEHAVNPANHFTIHHLSDAPDKLYVGIYNSAFATYYSVEFSLVVVC